MYLIRVTRRYRISSRGSQCRASFLDKKKPFPLSRLKTEASRLLGEIEDRTRLCKRRNVQDAVLLGSVLLQIRGHLRHGLWGPTCTELGISTDQARVVCYVYEHRHQIAGDQRFGGLGIDATYRRLKGLPPRSKPALIAPPPAPAPSPTTTPSPDAHEVKPVEVDPDPSPTPPPKAVEVEHIPPAPSVEKLKRQASNAAKRAANLSKTEKLLRENSLLKELLDASTKDYVALSILDDLDPTDVDRQPEINRLRIERASERKRADTAEAVATYWEEYAKRIEVALSRLSEAAA